MSDSDPIIFAIPGHHGYGASRNGRIWSRKKPHSKILSERWRLVATTRNEKGYLTVGFYSDNRAKRFFVHRLILETFVGRCPSSRHQCRHLNGIRDDNRLENLMWGTPEQNWEDRRLHALSI